MKSLMAFLPAAVIFIGTACAGDWQLFANDRFGAAADVPANYVAGEPPANNDGMVFTSPDGAATITVFGALATVLDDKFSDYINRLLAYDRDDGWNIAFSSGKADWFAFSGSKGDRIFYEKVVSACKGEIAEHVRLEYPSARKREFDPIVTHVAKSLHAEAGYECEG